MSDCPELDEEYQALLAENQRLKKLLELLNTVIKKQDVQIFEAWKLAKALIEQCQSAMRAGLPKNKWAYYQSGLKTTRNIKKYLDMWYDIVQRALT